MVVTVNVYKDCTKVSLKVHLGAHKAYSALKACVECSMRNRWIVALLKEKDYFKLLARLVPNLKL